MQPLLLCKSNEYYVFWVCVCSLVIKHAMSMRHIVICGLPHTTIFFHIISQTTRFLEKKLLNTECEFWFSIQLLSVTFLNLRNFEQDIIINMCIGLHVKYPLFLSDYNESWIFSTDFWKIMKYQISWKSVYLESTSSIRTDGWEDVWTDRQTDMTNLIVAFVNYVNIPYSINWLVVIKIYKIIYYPVRTGSLNKRFYPSSWKG